MDLLAWKGPMVGGALFWTSSAEGYAVLKEES